MDRVIAEAHAAREALMAAPPKGRNAFWRAGINVFYSTFHAPPGTGRAVVGREVHQRGGPQIVGDFMQTSIDHTTSVIETVRARGGAPDNLPARELATSLNLLNEAIMTASFAGQSPALPDERVLDNLVHIWLNAIYGETP